MDIQIEIILILIKKRLIEISGIIIVISEFYYSYLFSYLPNDPNFIFQKILKLKII